MFMTLLDLCGLKQFNQPTHLYGHILDLILSPSDQDTIVDLIKFISDHVLVKCSIAFPRPVAHIPNKISI